MERTRAQLLEQALGLTYRMLEGVDLDDWPAVIELESERRRLLERAFATRDPLVPEQAEVVRRILDLDKGLIEASTRVRDEIGDALEQLGRGSRANQAYQANMG